MAGAVGDAEQSVTYADRSGDAFQRMSKRTTHADALHQAGRRAEAETRFREAEQMQAERQPDYPLLYSLQGFRYCDLLLAAPERAAWQIILDSQLVNASALMQLRRVRSCRAVSQRAAQTLEWCRTQQRTSLLDIALDHLTLGRAALYAAILNSSDFRLLTSDRSHIDAAVDGLRRAGTQHHLPRGLLTRAWCSFAEASFFAKATKDESAHKLRGDAQEAARLFSRAQEDLDEAWEIAERGPMKLFMADIHLYRARLFGSRNSEVGSANEEGSIRGNRPPPISLPPRNSSTTAATTAGTRNSRTPKPSSWRRERLAVGPVVLRRTLTGGGLWRSIGRSPPSRKKDPHMITRNMIRFTSLAAFAAGALFLSGMALNGQAQIDGPIPEANLGVTKFGSADQVPPDSDIIYTITVTNSGPNSAVNAMLDDTLPGNMTFVSLLAPAGWTCSTPAPGAGGTISCSNPSLAPTAGEVFTLTGHVPRGRPWGRSTRTRPRSRRPRLIPIPITIVPAPRPVSPNQTPTWE